MDDGTEKIKNRLMSGGEFLSISNHEFLCFENNEWLIKIPNKPEQRLDVKINYGDDFIKALKYILKKH